MLESQQRKNPLLRQKTKIEFSGFERNILVDPLKLTEENEIVSLFNKIQEKLNSVIEVRLLFTRYFCFFLS